MRKNDVNCVVTSVFYLQCLRPVQALHLDKINLPYLDLKMFVYIFDISVVMVLKNCSFSLKYFKRIIGMNYSIEVHQM